LVKEDGSSETIAVSVWIVGLVDGPGGRWEVSGVGSEDVRSVVHWKVLTEERRGRGGG